jgi:type VI secretion system protein ImpA
LANGELDAAEGQAPEMSLINAAFADTPNEARNENYQAVTDALNTIASISDLLSEKVGVDRSISFASLVSELERIKKYYEQFGSQLNESTDSASNEEPEENQEVAEVKPVAAPVFSINSLEITNRSDAITVLDKVCIYFEQTEPNSPIPYLLKRAARIAHMNFMDLIQELSPNALEQAQEILGIRNTNDDESD